MRSTSFCEPLREAIELDLSRGRNAMAIWQDLVSESGFSGGYQTAKRLVRTLRGNQQPQPRAVILTARGRRGPSRLRPRRDGPRPQTGKYRRTRLFVVTLWYSRNAVRLLVFRSSSRIWAELHEKAFRRLAGCTRIVVLDNLREGVLVPDIYDPAQNPLIVMCSPTTDLWPCLAGSKIPIEKKSRVSSKPSATADCAEWGKSSADIVRRTSLSKQRNRHLQAVLVEAAKTRTATESGAGAGL